jgi:dihydroxyacetone kinase-like protein
MMFYDNLRAQTGAKGQFECMESGIMKRLMNDPDAIASEAVEGFSLAYAHYVRKLDGHQAVVRRAAPKKGQVAIVTGGGSGHEPMFVGYVGRGMAHGSVAGNIFTSPPPQPIHATANAVHAGAGILLVYGNYAGDVLNFDAAAEMLVQDGIEVASVRVSDDVASAPPISRSSRRGIAGDLFAIKVAGARAEENASLADVAAAAQAAVDSMRSMGVAFSSCTIPASGRPIFDLGPDEIELGMGLHGEPGLRRTKMRSADQLAGDLVDQLLSELALTAGDEICMLINGLGSVPVSELYVMSRSAHLLIQDRGVTVARSYIGNYATSLDMAGCSITVMRLDEELRRLILAPADSPAFVQV